MLRIRNGLKSVHCICVGEPLTLLLSFVMSPLVYSISTFTKHKRIDPPVVLLADYLLRL